MGCFSADASGAVFDLRRDDARRLFVEPPKGVENEDGRGVVFSPKTRGVVTAPLPVEGGRKYWLEITAGVEGDFVVEENPRAHILGLQGGRQGQGARYAVRFYDANGQEVTPLGDRSPGGFVLTREMRPYTAVFYTPVGASSLKVAFYAHGQELVLTGLKLAEEKKEGTLNANPDFRYGELSYCGWLPQREGRLYERPDGKVVLNAGYGGSSPLTPVKAGARYKVRWSAQGEGTLRIEYHDARGKPIVQRVIMRPKGHPEEVDVEPPEGTEAVRFVVLGAVVIEELRLTHAEDR